MTTAPAAFHNPAAWEQLPNARLSPTARDIFDVLQGRQEPGGHVRVTQAELGVRLNTSQSAISRAVSELRDTGLIDARTRHGQLLIHPLYAGYESLAHMVNHIQDPDTHLWPLTFPASDIRPPRRCDPRTSTDFDPTPDGDGGEPAPAPAPRPRLHLAG
ncbi:MarR family transcriptional regulator [Streptomyces sp. NPDC087440]|uniref:MarR family transcriptional regulator n=1 Tax=Streptomyces sp. NPDC087440 TaxID=3365790 RepID=UPI003804787D